MAVVLVLSFFLFSLLHVRDMLSLRNAADTQQQSRCRGPKSVQHQFSPYVIINMQIFHTIFPIF